MNPASSRPVIDTLPSTYDGGSVAAVPIKGDAPGLPIVLARSAAVRTTARARAVAVAARPFSPPTPSPRKASDTTLSAARTRHVSGPQFAVMSPPSWVSHGLEFGEVSAQAGERRVKLDDARASVRQTVREGRRQLSLNLVVAGGHRVIACSLVTPV
jgi:hypothetical protein